MLEILTEVQADIERLDEKQQKACSLIEETCREMVQEMKTVFTDYQGSNKMGGRPSTADR